MHSLLMSLIFVVIQTTTTCHHYVPTQQHVITHSQYSAILNLHKQWVTVYDLNHLPPGLCLSYDDCFMMYDAGISIFNVSYI